ncbi:hypothetical protein ABH995_000916 [Bradyrhizobium yuanmingense]
MKAEKQDVSHNQRTRPCARGCFQVMIIIAMLMGSVSWTPRADLADTITDENDVDRCVGDARRDRIVSCRQLWGAPPFPLL